jgi:hypothetical protein
MEGLEVLAQALLELRDDFAARARAHQAARVAVDLVRELLVGAGDGNELREACLEVVALLTQHLDLALHQRHRRAATGMRQAQVREQRLVAHEEVRILSQVVADGSLVGFGDGGAAGFAR